MPNGRVDAVFSHPHDDFTDLSIDAPPAQPDKPLMFNIADATCNCARRALLSAGPIATWSFQNDPSFARNSSYCLLIACTVNFAHAQNADAIKKRQEAYKGMIPQVKIGKNMLTGKQDFDAAAAKKIFATYAATAKTLEPLFPEDSKTGAKTAALPAIWENKADFEAKLAKFGEDASEAEATVTDLASFKAAWGKVMSNCGGCHKLYRAKED